MDRVFRALTMTVEEFAIVIFDDGSNDDTAAVAESAAQKYPFTRVRHNPSPLGLGYCTVHGSMEADTGFIVYVPADNTWPMRSFVELFGNLGKADVVTSFSSNLLSSMRFPKRLLSRSYSVILNLLFRKGVRYYNGLTIYPVEYLRRGPTRTQGFGFQAEALLKAVAAGYSFLEISLPVDADNLPKARSITVPNAVNAGITVLRLVADFYIFHRKLLPRPDSSVSEPEENRGPLRIVITGASSGIGAAIAKALAGDGHRIHICARRADRLAEVAAESPTIEAHVCDVSNEAQVSALVSALSVKLDAVDVLINCAGEFGEIGPFATADMDRWWKTIEANFKGPFLVTRYMLPLLRKGRQSRIINFAGGGAFSPYPNYSAYACSKSAMVRLTECLAAEFVPSGIRVNAIAPGPVPTEMHNATLVAGEQKAGRLQYRRTRALLEQPDHSMRNVVQCVRTMISPRFDALTGKTISSNFDPWQTQVFLDSLSEIVRSDLYAMRRVNVVNMPDGGLRRTLSQPWGDAPTEK